MQIHSGLTPIFEAFGIIKVIERFTSAHGIALFNYNSQIEEYEQIFSSGYPDALLTYLAHDFFEGSPEVKAMEKVLNANNCWEDVPRFRESQAVEEWFRPAGISEGSSMFFHDERGKLIGVLHVSVGADRFLPYWTQLLEAARPECEKLIRGHRQMSAYGLTNREREILNLVSHGKKNSSIARQLGLSTSTVNNHVESLLRKLDASSRTEAAIKVQALNLGKESR
ncbi:hypothetical protein ccrud_06395 [Corynebacterium crudilactis]|uniref:HTH luxR-type domain-containing protein n=2 Tax=Corynebacterium crudilactis TaxID=1652495 RepID=A0A172QT38_9CORY|nr:hypothetical protein ccrud_06395 [Corynebacterium crudilactis]